MRHIFIDTETTGFSKNRLIEVAALEFDPLTGKTGRSFHSYVRPGAESVEHGAFKVHGLSTSFLADKPLFGRVAPALKTFLEGATIYAHNAPFDTRVLNNEFAQLGLPDLDSFTHTICCSLSYAKRLKLPTVNSKLDTLCAHFGVDATARTLHGALIDCQLAIEVYIKMLMVVPPVVVPSNKTLSATKTSAAKSAPDAEKRPGWRPGGPWYDDEKESLSNLYASNTPLADICAKHNRSFVSIVMQLVKQGIITQEKCDELRAEHQATTNAATPALG